MGRINLVACGLICGIVYVAVGCNTKDNVSSSDISVESNTPDIPTESEITVEFDASKQIDLADQALHET